MRILATACSLLLLGSTPVLAARVVIEDPCDDAPWLESRRLADAGESVGSVTVSTLEAGGLPFVGSIAGIASIKGTPTGDAAVEVIGDTEMRAYGWCFSLNGVEPDEMPDQVFVTSEQDEIRWYFGYAHYKDGEWLSYCTPTNRARPAYICGEAQRR